MTTDPKKNTEIKDEDLDQVAGGAGKDVDRPDDFDGSGPLEISKERIEKI